MNGYWFLLALIIICLTKICLGEECSGSELSDCPTGAGAVGCLDGCDCQGPVLSCTKGFPVCIGSMIIDAYHTGPEVTSMSAKALKEECNKHIHDIVIRDFIKLESIEPGFFTPISHMLEEVHIRNNSMLQTLTAGLFQGNFGSLRLLAIEYHPEMSDISFLKNTDISTITELLLSFNNISAIPCGLFDDMHMLQKLDLQGNKIIFFDECQFGPLPYKNPELEINIKDNPLDCNCSMLSILSGPTARFNVMGKKTKCLKPYPFSIEDVIFMLRTQNMTGMQQCPVDVVGAARNSSPCDCHYDTKPEICEPDCVLWKERPPCNNNTKLPWLGKFEGCICHYFITYLDVNLATQWKKDLCVERGKLVRHIETMSWKIWLTMSGIVLVLGIIPLAFNLKKCHEERKSVNEENWKSVNEELIYSLLHGDDSKQEKRKMAKPHSAVTDTPPETLTPPNERRQSQQLKLEDISLQLQTSLQPVKVHSPYGAPKALQTVAEISLSSRDNLIYGEASSRSLYQPMITARQSIQEPEPVMDRQSNQLKQESEQVTARQSESTMARESNQSRRGSEQATARQSESIMARESSQSIPESEQVTTKSSMEKA